MNAKQSSFCHIPAFANYQLFDDCWATGDDYEREFQH